MKDLNEDTLEAALKEVSELVGERGLTAFFTPTHFTLENRYVTDGTVQWFLLQVERLRHFESKFAQ